MQILNDFQSSVRRALSEIDAEYETYPGLVICGTHTPRNVEDLLEQITEARVKMMPFLGICFGHQLAAIEYARNILGQKGATSEEFHDLGLQFLVDSQKTVPQFIVKKLPELKVGLKEDGESYWNNYEVIEGFESMWWKEDNFITCQFHPEYNSWKGNPHPLLVKFINYARVAK